MWRWKFRISPAVWSAITEPVFQSEGNLVHLDTAAILTVLGPDLPFPSQSTFRPPSTAIPNGAKPLIDSAEIYWSLLPNLEYQGENYRYFNSSGASGLQQYTQIFNRPWVLMCKDWIDRQCAPVKQHPTYWAEVLGAVSDVVAGMLVSDFPLELKKPPALGALQVGIDQYYASKHKISWSIYSAYPKILSLLAGHLLDIDEMKQDPTTPRTDWMTFHMSDSCLNYVDALMCRTTRRKLKSTIEKIFHEKSR